MTENAEMPNETEDRQRILLADDEASIRRILETRLKWLVMMFILHKTEKKP